MTGETQGEDGAAAEAGAERELKFIANRKTLKAALASPLLGGDMGPPGWRKLRTVYFDTEAGDLSQARVALRVRWSKDGWVMGLKRAAANGGAFEREEIETACTSGEPDLSLFDKAAAREVTDLTSGRPLAPRFGSEIRRAARTVNANGASIEVAFDQGFLFAGDKRAPAAEIELELKSGPPSALFALGLDLVAAFPLRLGLMSKAERAHALLTGEPPEPVYAEDPALRRDMSLDAAIAAILRNGLAHFLGNAPALEAGDAVEAVHQMRVAMRRLRSALGLFGRAFPCPEFEALRVESRRIATQLGGARDWDVFVGRLGDGDGLGRFAGEPGFDGLVAAAEAKAAAAHAAVARLARDPSIARFALRLERLAASRGWREGAGEETLAALDEPIAAFAQRWLEALHRKVTRRGRHFRSLEPKARHALRIAMKHMRYATDFFGGLFHPRSAVERYARGTADLQDRLGELNDAVIALSLVKALGSPRSATAAYAAGLATGWCARASEGDPDALRKAWRRFVEVGRFWRDE
jgi:inorganic triphosphatase YgiF